MHWAFSDDPIRSDHGLRGRARILLRKIDPRTMKPISDPIEFLPPWFCGADGRCDFRNLSVSYAGDKIAFDCRLSLTPADWVNDVRWNVCVADVGPDGRAQNPRFVMPPERRHSGSTVVRSDPFGLRQGGMPLKGPYDLHFWVRRRRDMHPVFSPDGARLYLASMSPDPRTGVDAAQTYHGSEHLAHIVAVNLDGSDPRTIYLNEGGMADEPFFLRNGNVAFHTWNLERMDRHMYTQATADGMSELPVLLGRVQGPNMWGRAVQLANGGILGMTGRRRSSIDTYVPFFADHTLGTGVDPDMPSFAILDPKVYEQVIDFPNGYCTAPPEGPSCVIDRYYADPSYLPDGRALVAHNDAKTYVLHGEDMFLGHVQGDTEAARIESMRPFVPKHMGISAIDLHGKTERLLDPVPGTMLTSPVWVGKRWAPRKQPWKTDEAKKTADLHIASVPAWFSFALDTGAKNKNTPVGAIVALRVLVKDLQGNACLNDGRPYRYAVNDGSYDHPTHLGRNDATGFTKLVVPRSAGGDAYGDVPLEADGSVHLRLPAGKLLLFQGIDANGHAVVQRSRLLSLAPGQKIDTSVRAAQYEAHCMSCHGALDPKSTFVGLKDIEKIPFVPMDFDTLAAKKADASSAPTKRYTFKDTVRPLLDRACVSCHSGSAPAGGAEPRGDVLGGGELPGGQVGLRPRARGSGVHGLGARERARARIQLLGHLGVELPRGRSVVQGEPGYAGLIASHAPLAGLAPWHPT
jgi:hypothetical protein